MKPSAIPRAALLAAALSALSASAWEGGVKLNDSAVRNAAGAVDVLGTEGSWANQGDTREHVFDGRTDTFFDPPTGDYPTWAGIAFAKPVLVTRLRYAGRAGWGGRMAGVVFQGANAADFSDAETFHTADPPTGWNPADLVDVTLDNVYGPYAYLRVCGILCGNASEVEFYGLADSGGEVPGAPDVTASWFINGRAGFRAAVDAAVPQVFRLQRRESAEDDFATFAQAGPEQGGGTFVWLDASAPSPGGEYRVRGVNANGKGPWTAFAITSRVEAAGTWIGTAGAWDGGGDTGDKAFDGDPYTFVDGPQANGCWTGLALDAPARITGARFAPRAGHADRMKGGRFQGANAADFSGARTLYTIREDPPEDAIAEVAFAEPGIFRYVRYLAPDGGYGNVAEVSFLLPEGTIDGPAAPTFSAPPGFYAQDVSVALAYPVEGAEIFYTLDGSTPGYVESDTCFRYTGPLAFGDASSRTNRLALIPTNPSQMWDNGQYGWAAPAADQPDVNVLRARAFINGVACTNEAAGTWLVGAVPNAHTLRVVSIQTDERNFFDDTVGLMVPGDVFARLGWNGFPGIPNANYFQHGAEWERPVVFELFETNREEAVSQRMGVRMHGNWSRACAQKTMCLYARAEYGAKKVKYRLFGDEEQTDFKRFLLRNSGNDWNQTGLRDAVGQSFFRGWVACGTQGYEPAVVYINGAYWGIENLRHHYSKHFFETWYGADPDNVDYLKMNASGGGYEVQEGDDADFRDLVAYLRAHDLATDGEAWEHVRTRIDIDSMIDYNIVNMFLANTDWPNNNHGFWRERVRAPGAAAPHDGRWRFVVFDTDHGLGLASDAGTDMLASARQHVLFASLVANPDFRSRFVTRYADLLNTALEPARMEAILDAAAARVRGEIPRHAARWTKQGSLANWEGTLNGVRSFIRQRGARVRAQLSDELGAGDAWTLTVATNGCGRVRVNTLESGDGPGRVKLPYAGTYFANVPVTLAAVAEPGWRFTAWAVGAEVYAEPTVTLSLSRATSATAVFAPAPPPAIVVNEVMADADGPDWFELYNAGAGDADLSGCWLVDDNPKNVTAIPAGVALPAGGFLLVRADAARPAGFGEDGVLNVPFGLGKKSDEVNLWNADRTQLLASVALGAAAYNASAGCWPNGDGATWSLQSVPTPGAPNRGPDATGAWLPDGVSTQVVAGARVTLACAAAAGAPRGAYALAGDDVPAGAAVSADGVFAWDVPASEPAGVRAVRVAWAAADGSARDETTLVVAVSRPAPTDGLCVPVIARAGATRKDGLPFVYWTEAPAAASYAVERAPARGGPYAAVATVPRGVTVWQDAAGAGLTNWYRVTARTSANVPWTEPAGRACESGLAHLFSGDVVGTPGSWGNQGNTKEMLFDGDTSTFFDAPVGSAWAGLDLGESAWRVVSRVRYWPRSGFAGRMTGVTFDFARESDGENLFTPVGTFYAIANQPPDNRWTAVDTAGTNDWRFVRFNSPAGNGNAAEIEFWGFDDVPAAPARVDVADRRDGTAAVTWPEVPHARGYLVWMDGAARAFVATNAAVVARSSARAQTLGVSALNGSGHGPRKSVALPPAPPPPFLLILR